MEEHRIWALAPDENAWVRALRTGSWRVERFLDAQTLLQVARSESLQGVEALVLLSDVVANCQVAQVVRPDHPAISLVAGTSLPAGPEQTALLASGVDHVLRLDDPPAHLAAVLRALAYRRVRLGHGVSPQPWGLGGQAGTLYRVGAWQLAGQGWYLQHGDGAPIRLTVCERALLLCLFEAPGHVMAHADLISAIRQVWKPRSGSCSRDPKGRAIISRLRQRALRAGMPEPPVESLRDFGYAWAL